MSTAKNNVAELSADKRELLELLWQEDGDADNTFPVSFSQQRLWFLDQLEPGNPFYNISTALHLKGRLQIAALEKGLNEIVRRHEILRTSFSMIDGQPVQVIADDIELQLPVRDLSTLPQSQRQAEVERLASLDASLPFDLTQAPLTRLSLLRLNADEHVLLCTLHHIISDGWSMGVLVQEVAALYEAFTTGAETPLVELPVQYADYAVWQREWLQGPVLEEQLSYWREQLAGAPAVLELPSDRPRPAVQSFAGALHHFHLSRELSEQLNALSRGEGVTLFMTLLAAFQTLLHRYTNQTDIVVGTPIANRGRAETEALIGFFVNMLVMRADVSRDPTFRELLGDVKEVSLGAYAHQDVPFEKLVEELQPERSLSHSPLFQVMFILQNMGERTLKLTGLDVTQVATDSHTAKFDLTLTIEENEGVLGGNFEYKTDLFDASTISRMAEHFEVLLQSIAGDPDQRLSNLSMLPEDEHQLLVHTWNAGSARDYPKSDGLHHLFESQVERTPEAIAVRCEGRQLTYRELNSMANRLAHRLRAAGVGTDSRVGILMERSLDMIAGLLGILKAGAAYIPLDPTYPIERLSFVLQDAHVSVLLTQASLSDLLPSSELQKIYVDSDETELESTDNIGGVTTSENLAYVIYTSGSTGKPKGVQITHGAVINLLHSIREQIGATERDVVLGLTTLSFDIAEFEIHLPLMIGACVELVSREVAIDPSGLAEVLEHAGVTIMQATPVTWRMLLDNGWRGNERLTVLTAGEPLLPDLAERLLHNCGSLWNLYGPSETTIYSTGQLVERGQANISIGRPVANTRIYLLDQQMQPVPIGVAGEMYIGGEGVGRGYVSRPDLTAEKFIPDAFGDTPGARLYKTGDAARYLPDGRIDFIGRIDRQIKLRGFRIELGEIESVLRQHAAVKECVVAMREQAGDKRLIAYVVAEKGAVIERNELRSHVKQQLPDYMVPSRFVELAELPLTPNGKVDQRALPAPDQIDGEEQGSFVGPRTAVEEIVAGIWSEVLQLDRISTAENFFGLGGHSLLVTQVIARVREVFKIELPVRSMFEASTLAEFAERVENERLVQNVETLPLLPRGPGAELPLSFAQQRLWFLHQLAPGNSFYNMPAALRMTGQLDHTALEQCLNEIVRRQESLRTSFIAVEGKPRQVIAEELIASLPLTDLSALATEQQSEEIQQWTNSEAKQPFDLTHAPLARARLLKLRDDEHILLFTMHHIISDGWSLGVLVNEVAEIYTSIVTGDEIRLPDLRVQYADYAMWQRQWFEGAKFDEQLAYWRQELQDVPTLQLPNDHRRAAIQTFSGASHNFTFSRRLSEQVRELSRRNGATLYMTLLAAFDVLLARYTGQEDIVVGSPIANRTQRDVEGLIGFFVNTLVMRTNVSGNPSFSELIGRVREVALNAYAHQDMPFERLVEDLEPDRDLSRQPLFQVMFAVQNAPIRPLELPSLTISPMRLETTTTRFDLELTVSETEAGRLTGEFRCSSDVFDVASMHRMTGHLETLLENIVDAPAQSIWSVPLLTSDEERQLLVEWNDTQAGRAEQPASITRWFEQQVERTPDATALTAGNVTLSYRELNTRANQLAHHLRQLGVERETLVGLYLERSAEMIVALLATLKAGGTYVPLNPEYPRQRLALMIDDSAMTFLITQQSLLEGLPETRARVICVDRDTAIIEDFADGDLDIENAAADVAYIIYTSGSAGKPKGVRVGHGNLVHTLLASVETFDFNASDTMPCLAAMSFDISLFEVLNPLLTGGRLVFVTREDVLDLDALLAHLAGATIFHAVPSLLRQIVGHIKQQPEYEDRFTNVRMIFTGGEAVPPDLIGEAQKVFANAAIKVLYGPTEATIICASFAVDVADEVEGHMIGRPLPNVRMRVYDAHRNLVPVGVAGELYLGGGGVARGYLNHDELTNERFVEIDGARYYRTGDRVRYLADGNLEFLGRVDEQVKIRGFRIELGDIETALNSHPMIQESVATVNENETGEKRLIAYVVQDPTYVEETETHENWEEEHVSQWQCLYDETYGGNTAIATAAQSDDDEFNIIGWNSSYTGDPIPAPEMREWVDSTVNRIRTLNPRRVLEIGCGTGLLLLPLARYCESYRGTDFSRVILHELADKVCARGLNHVELLQRRADEFDESEAEKYDVVIINSVVQYFPSVEYLVRVLEGVVKVVAPGGVVFIGDVRNLPLLETLHTSIEALNAPAALSKTRLRQRVQNRLASEKELVLHPNFFHALRDQLPEISGVSIELKRGIYHNELTRFRYDVLLCVGGGPEEIIESTTRWSESSDLNEVVNQLRAERPEVLRIDGVGNARVAADVRKVDLLKVHEGPQTVGEIPSVDVSEAAAVDPEEWWRVAEVEGYVASLSWSETGESGSYDVLLTRDSRRRWMSVEANGRSKDWATYANNPLRVRSMQSFARNLVPQLRAFLVERVPDYMLPSVFVLLDEIPLTPNGKVDRRVLPAPTHGRAELVSVERRTPLEELLAGIWSELLGVEDVGVTDNFFELGGHSLLITQLLSRVRQDFAVELPLRHLFEAPTVAGLAARIEDAIREGAGLQAPPIVPVARDNELPLSYAQERLWFIDQYDPNSTAYILPAAIRLSGRLNIEAFEQSIAEIVRRHESLRTTFASMNGRPVQVIPPEFHIPVSFSDFSALDEVERETAVKQEAEIEANTPFDLSAGPLVRVHLLRLEEKEHVLLFTLHHIISDGWSMGVLVRELVTLYQAFDADQQSPLPDLAVQYADFAVWQREWQQGEFLEKQLAYWKAQLEGEPPVLNLPTDRPRPAVQSYRGAQQTVALPRILSEELQSLSRREGVTLFMTLLAAWQTLLHRYTGQDDIIVGSPIANRNRTETEPLIGFFVNTLVMRTNLAGNPPFREILKQVRETALGAYAHQDLPFEKLVEELQPQRDTSHTPIVQVVFALQNAPMPDIEMPDLTVGYLEADTAAAKFDLTLLLQETPDGLRGSLQYRSELFDATTIKRMLGHFENLLSGVVANPDEQLASLPLLSDGERRHLLYELNESPTNDTRGSCLQELFEAQVELRPDAVALVYEGSELSYEELNSRANQVAHYLRDQGVGPDTLVGLFVERSLEMVVGLLGILKAGGAYVPLDPSYPQERLEYMLEDSAPPIVLTQAALEERLSLSSVPRLRLDADWELLSAYPTRNLGPDDVGLTADRLAYVIYTSGSTGKPKGVMVEHREVQSLLAATEADFRFGSHDVWTLFHSYAFDFSVWEIWGALAYGGQLIVIPKWVARSPEDFYELVRTHRVTVLNQTPSAFYQFADVDAMRGEELALRVVVFGGEALNLSGLSGWVERHTDDAPALVNMYGITETTVHVTYRRIRRDDVTRQAGSVIGRPIQGWRVYLLDAHQVLVPEGTPGEMYVGGAGVARGYLNREELTAARFVENPYVPGERLYRSGDLARYVNGGELEYLGRTDHQVKLRGFRIELGEIEQQLVALEGVSAAAVIAREDEVDEKRLVAYVVPNGYPAEEEAPGALKAELIAGYREALSAQLPDYMVPARFVLLSKLPLTTNGKVDRKRLPAPDDERPDLAGGYAAPRTAVEELVAAIWADVLGLERVGVNDNFFDLGGHSLLATQVVSRMREAFRVEIPLRLLFESPTAGELAQSITSELGRDATMQSPPIVPVSRDRMIPASFAQQRLWFIDQLGTSQTAYNIPFALRLTGPLNRAALEESINEVVARHEVLRTTFATVDGLPVQVINPPRAIEIPFVDLSQLPWRQREAEIRILVNDETQRRFDLAEGPLLRTMLVRTGELEHIAVLTMHHIITDGWSIGVLINEVAALYESAITNTPATLKELSVQYADFSVWQREWLQGEVLESQLSYWKEQLADAPDVLQLPADRPRPAVQHYTGALHRFTLSGDLGAELTALSRREGVTLFMTLLAAWQTLLHRYSGQDDIVVGSPIANRNRAETEPLIGFFVNTLAMRTDLSGEPTFRDLLTRVREVSLGAYAHQDLPFEKLIEELQPERSLSHTPMFQVVFVLQNAPSTELRFSTLQFSPFEIETSTTHFDLTLALTANADALNGWLEYNTELFDATTIERMLGHYENLLRAVTANPDERIARLRLASESEQAHVVEQWNDTATDYPRDRGIHELFEEQAASRPEAVALISAKEQLTYAELNQRANRLARVLHRRGVATETLVCVWMDRSVDMVVTLLAILKAGGVYVAFESSEPEERLSLMLQDAGVKLIVTQQRRQESMPEGFEQIYVDAEDFSGEDSSNLSVPFAGGQQLAYVSYTSGSTGRPKGVAVPHRGVVRLVKENDFARLNEKNTFLPLAPISFDASTLELWGALLNGGRCALLSEKVLTAAELGAAIRDYNVNTMWLTSSLFNSIVNEDVHALAGLEQLLVGGEALSVPHIRQAVDWLPKTQLINGYGPTENTTFTCCFAIRELDQTQTSIPIGRPIMNTQVYILDHELQPVPVGVAGELYLGGEGLARGYLRRSELTAEKFVPHPFSRTGGERLYRSGDLGRWLPTGEIEFLGRIDNQVKLRGFRIELGEIEAVLREHDAVQESAVVVSGTGADARLFAYVVAEVVNGNDLRSYLKQRLPEYMVPSAFLVLDEMPLTASGKVDRRRLPAPDGNQSERGESYVVPSTAAEELVAGIWAEVLDLERVGVNDNFFDLGGHSLLATQVTTRVRESLKVDVPLRALFESSNLFEFAKYVEAEMFSAKAPQAPPVVPVPRNGTAPLSFSQERLWFLDQLQPDSAAYNVLIGLELSGSLDVPALERSIQEIVRRHETLRTSFSMVNGQLVQVIAGEIELEICRRDLSEMSESTQQAEIRRLACVEGSLPFDLWRAPLLRVWLLRLSAEEHVLLCTVHHIISDGWSMGVLVREVAALYEAFANGTDVPLPELPVQYADYSVWQREWLQGVVLDEQMSYWREQLAGAPTVLELPTDRPRPPVQSFAGTLHSFEISRELSEQLNALSRRQGVTMFMTLLAAYQTLLHRYTNQTDIVVGTPIANRGRGETEGLIGFFVNMLVMRADLSGDPTFRELLDQVKEVSLGAYAHQDVPFEKLVEELQPERSLSHSPLFQVEFVLQNMPVPELKLSGLTLKPLSLDVDTTHFDLSLIMQEAEHGLKGWVQYNTDLFHSSTIERMCQHFTTLLEGIVSTPELPVSKVPLLSASEQAHLLDLARGPAVDYPRELTIHEAFERQAAATPERIAVVSGFEQLSYAELDQRANALALRLRGLGVQPEKIAGVMLERSADMVVSLLGILKAGGAYLPLDSELPADRLAFMLDDSNVEVLVMQEHLVARLPLWATESRRLVLVDAYETNFPTDSERPFESGATANNLAYVIYTSGSTGQPKAVMVQHRSPINLLQGLKQAVYADLGSSKLRASINAPLSFDASMQQLILLLEGFTLFIVPNDIRADGRALLDFFAEHEIDVFDCTPSQLGLLLSAGLLQDERIKPSRYLVAGEAMEAPMWQTLAQSSDAVFFNIYGPTECTVDTTATRVSSNAVSPHIGAPLANSQVYLLDRIGEPVPSGVAGEICIGGEGLARGYLNRADLTAERFVPNPFSSEPGARLYRTGDLARYTTDGQLQYLGRLDHQVKVRGFRIELGEIEAVLMQHAFIKESVVIVREDDNEKRIVAYVVTEEGIEVTTEEIKQHLREQLPDYMVPQSVVTLEAIPLTRNGKVDRRALPAPDSRAREIGTEYVAPATPIEEMVAGIWSELFGIERIGVNDNFFGLGGHSLLATQVLARVEEVLSVKLPLRDFFEATSIKTLTRLIESALREERSLSAPPIIPVEREGVELPLSFAQQRLWLLDQLAQGASIYNVPSAMRLQGRLHVAAMEQSLTELEKRHEVLRTTFTNGSDRQPVQVIHPPREEVVTQIDLSALPELERQYRVHQFVVEETETPFDLTNGPVWRARLLRLSDEEHILLVTMHHIVSDGWSIGLMMREVATMYAALSQGQAPELPELQIQYADYATWQRSWLQNETLEEHLSYWLKQFAVMPHELELPTDFERPAVRTYRGASQPVRVSKHVTTMLKDLSRREGVTLFMTLLAAFKLLLHRYTAQDDIVVGSPIANRNHVETENLIGCFINTLALRTNLGGSPTFRELLGRVRDVTFDAYAHQDLPFELLVSRLHPERKANTTPLFQVWFALHNIPAGQFDLPGISISRIDSGREVSQFDLTLTLGETPDGLDGLLNYNSDLFEAETVAQMVQHLVRLLEEVALSPDLQLFDVQLHEEENNGFGDVSVEPVQDSVSEDEFVL
jgi:amino acid adenylation domain-containing protein